MKMKNNHTIHQAFVMGKRHISRHLICFSLAVVFGLPLLSQNARAGAQDPAEPQELRAFIQKMVKENPGLALELLKNLGPIDHYDLGRDEGPERGQTLSLFVALTDEQLRQRLALIPKTPNASTWTDRETAEKTISDALRSEKTRVDKWMHQGYPRPPLVLRGNAGRIIGRSLRRGAAQSIPCKNAMIHLEPEGRDSFYVLMSYPEP